MDVQRLNLFVWKKSTNTCRRAGWGEVGESDQERKTVPNHQGSSPALPGCARRTRRPEALSNISPRLWEAQLQAGQTQMEELQEQVEAYERLHVGKSKEVVLEAVEDLPQALIRARIGAGLTQAGLARRLGVKPQQVQRYEATDYEKASFSRILKVVQALGLTMPKAVRLVRNG